MLLDNKSINNLNHSGKVYEYIKNYVGNGQFDLVTGYFTIRALALLHQDISTPKEYRMILGNLMSENLERDKIIDLLNGDAGVSSQLEVSLNAKKAVTFLKQEKVKVKSIQGSFCHAKTYIYTDQDERFNFQIIGSSNLTDSGMGIRESSNIELNTASTGASNDFNELKNWFNHQWEKVATELVDLPNDKKMDVKSYIISLIEDFYKRYTPRELYYKVLYELFKEDLEALDGDREFKKEIAHLEETILYSTLFDYQQKGVISLIKMLQRYNGAILADAVGLGKTWTALAVMKYFQLKGYTVVLFCPKKLQHNWIQYRHTHGSRFDKDELEYYVRFHTDLQNNRLSEAYPDFGLTHIQRKSKLLIVIDESHNLRNDKSARFKYLVEQVLMPEKKTRDVKVLQLSATPINNKLIDIRNQFKLMAKGDDTGFKDTDFKIKSLEILFRKAQEEFTDWCETPNRKISTFISKLPEGFEKLTDALIVARTRKMISDNFGSLNFPKKNKPINVYEEPGNIGELKCLSDILQAIEVRMTAYRPSDYQAEQVKANVLEDERQRQKFLVKMMYILLIKRLESSWVSFEKTAINILKHHENALDKVYQFQKYKTDLSLQDTIETTVEENELFEDAIENINLPENDSNNNITIGKKNPISISSIKNLEQFKKDLEHDIAKLTIVVKNLSIFRKDLEQNNTKDNKFEELSKIIREKQKLPNKKIIIFTVFADTANYLYDSLLKSGFTKIGVVTGTSAKTSEGYISAKFNPVLEAFAPYTKLYLERDWENFYLQHIPDQADDNGKFNVDFTTWKELILKHDKQTSKTLKDEIDILIATDCLSEGQNLQDADMLVNYDIHWNPVRIIQRMGRIDRLGSVNTSITGVNFWPSNSYDSYLKLKRRVESRLALMCTVGTEFDDHLTPDLEKIVEDNPLVSKQTEKLLNQMNDSWDDLDVSDENLGLNDLSLEQFRQELLDFFKQHQNELKRIPNGVFTGFKVTPEIAKKINGESIIGVLGYPRKPEGTTEHTYEEIRLVFKPTDTNVRIPIKNQHEILSFLRAHRDYERYVTSEIESGDKQYISNLANVFSSYLQELIPNSVTAELKAIFSGLSAPKPKSKKDRLLEEKYTLENFDLITWFIISK